MGVNYSDNIQFSDRKNDIYETKTNFAFYYSQMKNHWEKRSDSWILNYFQTSFLPTTSCSIFWNSRSSLKNSIFSSIFLCSFNYGILSWKFFSLTSFSIEKVCQNRLVESCRLSLEKKALVNWAQRNQYCPFFSKSEKNARGNLGTHNDSANITPNF